MRRKIKNLVWNYCPQCWTAAAVRWLGQLRCFSARRRHIGTGSYVDASVQVIGWDSVRIGANCLIGEQTWINVNHRDAEQPALIIGDNVVIGRRNYFSTGKQIKIGSFVLTTPNCCFLGSDHVFSSPFVPYLLSGTTSDGIIEVGVNCWLGTGVTVLAGVKIGFGSVIGASAVVTKDIPPLSVAIGSPARVVRRFDVRAQDWVTAAAYPPDGDLQLPTEADYLVRLKQTHPKIGKPLHASSSRFGDLL
ncbi:MAG: DapH/DapD/GlmU-related protein [Planctomycetota bacterium]